MTPVRLHWFLPTNGDSHTDLSLGNAVGAHGARIDDAATNARKGDIAYMSQVARAAESLGFEAALTPTSSWCEEAWVITAALPGWLDHYNFRRRHGSLGHRSPAARLAELEQPHG